MSDKANWYIMETKDSKVKPSTWYSH